jgi:alkanesulfonate monooxygenase SsuD/methylene tetrahydromethanopterin reductase-like flavin-dependent oxidoreductase (luciferase family)
MSFAFGIFDSFDLGISSPGEVLANRLDFAVAAEAAGIDHYHVTEHHGTPLSVCPSPNLFLAALSQRTSRMRLGPLVYVLPAYDPLRLAEEIAVLDQLSGGRLDVGIGSGVSPYELAFLGVDASQARAIYAETLEAVRTGLATGQLTHTGTLLRDYDVALSVRPVQQPHPPLWYASSNTATAEWAGAHGVNFVGKWNGGKVVGAVEAYWSRYSEAHGGAGPAAPEPRIGIQSSVYIGATDDEAYDRFRKANDVFMQQLTHLWHLNDDPSVDALTDSDAAIRSGNALVGSVETVRNALLAQAEAAPINFFEATLAYGDLSQDEALANLRTFAEEIIPAVREQTGR